MSDKDEIVVYANDQETPQGPPHDDRWCDQVIDEWYSMWTDVEWTANIRASLHIPALMRLFTYKHRWLGINDECYTADLMIQGSMEQMVKNPLFAELRELEKTIIAMEKEFGLTLRSASLIDLDLAQGAKSWVELQAMRKKQAIGASASEISTKKKKALPTA